MITNASARTGSFAGERPRLARRRLTRRLVVGVLLPALALAGLFAFRQYNLHRFHLEKQVRFMMDTYVTVYAVGPKTKTLPAVNAALERMQAVDDKFSSRNPQSPVFAFNHRNEPITDREVLDLVGLSLQVARDTSGAFDITVAPLIELWGFYGDSPRVPEAQEIQRCLERVGYGGLILTDTELRKDRDDLKIDLGAVAKGYAVGQAAAVLKERGVAAALIDAGGDIFALGRKAGQPWKVGLRKPRGEGILGYLEVEDVAVMGSGDYERFFVSGASRYHHIFDPRTGYPAEGVQGTTLLHPDPAVADAWNTAVFVLGPERGLDLVERIPGMEALMVTTSGDIVYSSGLARALKNVE